MKKSSSASRTTGKGIIYTVHEPRRGTPVTESFVDRLRELGASKEAVDFAKQRVPRPATK